MACGILATFGASLIFHPGPSIPWQTLVAGCGFFTLGALDDRFSFHPRRKFIWFALFSFLAAWPWAFSGPGGSLYTIHVGACVILAPRWAAFPVLALWFLSVPNAVNIEDAINGYMGGFTLILLVVAAFFGVNVLIPIGAIFAFLLLNWPKSKHFLGDAGSFGCGFMIAEVLLRAGGNHRPFSLLLLTAPISMDVCIGIIRRVRLQMSLFEADRSTCPHHMVTMFNQSHGWATLTLWANAVVIAILSSYSTSIALGYLILFGIFLTFLNRVSLFTPPRRRIEKLSK